MRLIAMTLAAGLAAGSAAAEIELSFYGGAQSSPHSDLFIRGDSVIPDQDLFIAGGVNDTGGVSNRAYQAMEGQMRSVTGISGTIHGMAAVTFNPPRGLG